MVNDALGYYNVVYIMVNGVIRHEMTLEDYNAVVDGLAPIESLANRRCRCALVALDEELNHKFIVTFSTHFDQFGFVDEGWELDFTDVLFEGESRTFGEFSTPLFDRNSVPVRLSRWLWTVDEGSKALVSTLLARVRENRLRFISVGSNVVLEDCDVPLLFPEDDMVALHAEQKAMIQRLELKLAQKEQHVERLLGSMATLQSQLTLALRRVPAEQPEASAFEDPTGVTVPFLRRSR